MFDEKLRHATVPYDELVVASGAREPVDAVPGMAEHGFTLRAPGQFGRFLNRLSVVAGTGSGRIAAEAAPWLRVARWPPATPRRRW